MSFFRLVVQIISRSTVYHSFDQMLCFLILNGRRYQIDYVILSIRCCFSIRNISYHQPRTSHSSPHKLHFLSNATCYFLPSIDILWSDSLSRQETFPLSHIWMMMISLPPMKKVREVLSQPCVVKATLDHNNDIHIHSFELFLLEAYSSQPPLPIHSLLILITL